MDTSEVKRICNEWAPVLKRALALHEWTVDVVYARPDDAVDGQRGRCTSHVRYMRAEVYVDPAEHETEEEVLFTLRHEFLHLLHCEDEVLRAATTHMMPRDAFNAWEELLYVTRERTVRNVERLLDHGLGLGPAKMRNVAESEELRQYEDHGPAKKEQKPRFKCLKCGEEWVEDLPHACKLAGGGRP